MAKSLHWLWIYWKTGWMVFCKFIAFYFMMLVVIMPIMLIAKLIEAGWEAGLLGPVTHFPWYHLVSLVLYLANLPIAFSIAARTTGVFGDDEILCRLKEARVDAPNWRRP